MGRGEERDYVEDKVVVQHLIILFVVDLISAQTEFC